MSTPPASPPPPDSPRGRARSGAPAHRQAHELPLFRLLAEPAVCQALATVVMFFAFSGDALRALVGWPGWVALLVCLVLASTGSLIGQAPRLEWRGALPFSLIAVLLYLVASIAWSQYSLQSLFGALSALAFTALGVFLALGRDLIQAIRALADALRAFLAASLALELFSGLVLPAPVNWLGASGNLAAGGPITGIAGTRNLLGFVACLAVVTFVVELRTKSVTRGVSLASLSGAALTLLFTRSPVTVLALAVVGVATVAIFALRRVPRERKAVAQYVLGGILLLSLIAAWMLRSQILELLGANHELDVRVDLWRELLPFAGQFQAQGWGWIGEWNFDVYPFDVLAQAPGVDSGLNAGMDVYLQLGAIGAVLMIAATGLAFARSWLLATEYPSSAYAWPALVLVLTAVTNLAQSYLLSEGGLMLFVYCAIAVARKRSWRHRVGAPLGAPGMR